MATKQLYKILILLVIIFAVSFAGWKYFSGGQFSAIKEPTPGSCLVLPEEYCRSGSTVSWPNKPPQLDLSPILGLVLPAGTPIFAPFDGELRVTGKSPINPQAPAMSLKNAAGQDSFLAFGDISYAVQPESGSFSVPVRKGEVLATVASSGMTAVDKYNMAIYFANSQEIFKRIFP